MSDAMVRNVLEDLSPHRHPQGPAWGQRQQHADDRQPMPVVADDLEGEERPIT